MAHSQLGGNAGSEACEPQPLFGGAIQCCFPSRFQDVSEIRQVPNNQEAYVDADRDESIVVELLEMERDVADHQSAAWFLQDLAGEQDAGQDFVVEAVRNVPPADAPFLDPSTVMTAAVGKLAVSKGRQGVDARNIVRVYLANFRLRSVNTDVLITVYEPLFISEHSHSAHTVGVGATTEAALSGCMEAADIFQMLLKTFKINNWSLFTEAGRCTPRLTGDGPN